MQIKPFNPITDQLNIVGDGNLRHVKAHVRENGIIELVGYNSQRINITEWNEFINFPAYRLNTDNELPHSCPKFAYGRYPRIFTIYAIDQYGRYSNIIRKNLDVKATVFLYTNTKPVIITNAASFTKSRITQSLYDPIRQPSSFTNFTRYETGEGGVRAKEESLFDF